MRRPLSEGSDGKMRLQGALLRGCKGAGGIVGKSSEGGLDFPGCAFWRIQSAPARKECLRTEGED